MTWPPAPQELSIVGFSGAPVPGGAGLKPPVFRHDATGRFFTTAHEPPRFYDSQEVEAYEQQRLLARTEQSWEPIESGVILYAHRQFMEAGADCLSLDRSRLGWDERLGAWVVYEKRAQALRQLARWGQELIRDAKEHLHEAVKRPIESSRAEIERVLNDARRARFCAPPPEHQGLREEAFACWAAALLLDGRPIDALLRDAHRDFPGGQTIERIEETARRLARPQSPIYPERKWSEHLSWGRPAT